MWRALALTTLLLSSPASAQSLAELMCQTKPTIDCALEIAVAATRSADATTSENLPWGRLIETASRAGRVDIAFALSDKLDSNQSFATAEIVSALTRAGRAEDVAAVLAKQGKTPADYAFAIGPVLVELDRDAEIEALKASIANLHPMQVESWFVKGDLQAGRSDRAIERLAKLPEKDRRDLAGLTIETLFYSGYADKAKPILSMLPEDRPALVCQIAESLRDPAFAKNCLEGFRKAPKEDATYIQPTVATALAASGDWKQALEIARTLDDTYRPTTYVNIAIYSREPEVLRIVDARMREEPAVFTPDRLNNLLVRALIFCGYEPAARTMIAQAATDYDREIMSTFAAAAVAELGRPQEAMTLALAIPDMRRKAWALWEVASKLKE